MNVISYAILSSTTRASSDLFFPTHIWRIGDPPFRVYIAHGWPSVRLDDSVCVYPSWGELASRHGLRCDETDLQEGDYPPDETDVSELADRFRRSGDEPTGDLVARAARLPYRNDELRIEAIVWESGAYDPDEIELVSRTWAHAFWGETSSIQEWLSAGVTSPEDALFLHTLNIRPDLTALIIPSRGVPPFSNRSVAWHLSTGTISPLEAVGWATVLRDGRDDILARTIRWLVSDETAPIRWDVINEIAAARTCVTSLGRVASIIGEMVVTNLGAPRRAVTDGE